MTFSPNPGSPLRLFSAKLRGFHQRRADAFNSGPSPDLPADQLVKSSMEMVPILLDAYGYSISEWEYAEIEAGERMPADPHAFIEAISSVFNLTDDETAQLTSCLSMDILSATLTAPVALEALLYLLEDDPLTHL